jgi:putative toxin-antitoxin system antitoxin component (TIGR02293 family)
MVTSARTHSKREPAQAKDSPRGDKLKRPRLTRPADPAAKSARASSFAKLWSFAGIFDFDPIQRVQMIKRGLPATVPGDMATRMGMSKERLYLTIGLPRATVERKARESTPLSAEESSRVLGLGHLVGQVQRMVEQSGQPEGFDAAAWVARWLDRPVAALGGMRPAELMDTGEGQRIVSNLLSRAQSGAFS